jgi:hypothetical protein
MRDVMGMGTAAAPTRIFFDTEFTQFRDGELLSIAFLADDDRSLVVEIHDSARHQRASDFCHRVVLPQFGAVPARAVADDAAAGLAIAEWLTPFPEALSLCYDYKLDWRYLEAVLRAAGQWDRLAPRFQAFNVADVAYSDACLQAQDAYFARQTWPARHHPLVDAFALRERWRAHERAVQAFQTPP